MSDWISSPIRYLNREEQEHNVDIIYPYLYNLGWTSQACAGAFGNMQKESTFNVGIWEGLVIPDDPLTTGKGYGLTQWTPARKLINWASSVGLDYTDGDTQLAMFTREWKQEDTETRQWSNAGAGMTFLEFSLSTDTPYNLARVFCDGYERPLRPDYDERGRLADRWYEYIGEHPPSGKIPIWMLFKFNPFGGIN